MNGSGEVTRLPKDYAWVLIESFIREKGLIRQHLDSYNKFIQKTLQEIIDEQGIIETSQPGLYIKLGKIHVDTPRAREADGSISEILPMESRIRDLTYAAPLYLTMTLVVDGEKRGPVKSYIGDLPIMVKSVKCPLSGRSEKDLIEVC